MTRLDVPEVCSSVSQPELRRRRSCVEDDLVLAVIGKFALLARLGAGGGRILGKVIEVCAVLASQMAESAASSNFTTRDSRL